MVVGRARKEQAGELATLINHAGEGIPMAIWASMREGDQTALEVGQLRAAREEGGFSYRNARVCEQDGRLLGMCISYRQPDPYDLSGLEDYPAIVRPLVELEARAPGSWYINALATHEFAWGQGVARKLIADAERQARESDCRGISLIVASDNLRAVQLYDYLGFVEIDRAPVVSFPGFAYDGDWVAMMKPTGC